MKKMKQGLDEAGLTPFLFVQPLAYMTPDAGKQGFIDLPEFPFALEPRICTRLNLKYPLSSSSSSSPGLTCTSSRGKPMILVSATSVAAVASSPTTSELWRRS